MAKVYPQKLSTFVVAEAIREEANKKATILGAVAGGRMIVPLGAPRPLNIQLAIFVVFKDGEGEFAAKLKVYDPGDTLIGDEVPLGTLTKQPEQSLQIVINFGAFPILRFGTYRVQIILDDHAYEDDFSVTESPDAIPNSKT